MDIMLSHLLIKLNTHMLYLYNISLYVVLTLHFFRLFMLLSQMNNYQ